MSAREELYKHLWWAVPSSDDEEASVNANKLIDDLLHEEAEKIRDMERRNAWPERHGIGGAVLPQQVADFIDPYVK